MNESKATRYQRSRRRTHALAVASTAASLTLVAVTPIGRWLYAVTFTLVSGAPAPVQGPIAFVLFIAAVTLLCEVAALPAVLYRALRLDPSYGQESPNLRSWFAGTVVGLPVVLLAASIVWLAGRISGDLWWLMAGITMSAVLALAVNGGPAILAGLATVKPLGRPELTARISEVAKRAGVPVAAIVQWDVDESANTIAMVAGVGQGRRVLVAGDVARQWSDDEVTVIVAHELAHHVHHDLWRALALNTLVLCAAFRVADIVVNAGAPFIGLADIGDVTALPLIALVSGAVWIAATPLRLAQSRRQERRADLFALESTGHADAFAAAIRRASARHLAEERPSSMVRWMYHRHPSVVERLALAETRRGGRESR